MYISINSHTSGKFRREMINNRSHIVTSMMPIRGDIAMNGIFYPNKEVKASFEQLHDLPAPNGHPVINGVHVSAFKPVSMNAFNVGGFIRNPKMKGKEVFVDFVIDEQVANNTDDGKEIIKRIEEGKKIGVSTGLNIDQIELKNGKDDFGASFDKIGSGFKFDHVAIILNEKAAGDHAGTELVLNTANKDDPIHIVNLVMNQPDQLEIDLNAEHSLSASDIHEQLNHLIASDNEDIFKHVIDFFPEDKKFLFSISNNNDRKIFEQSYAVGNDMIALVGEPVEVILQQKITPVMQTNEENDMNKELMILAIIANTHNAFNGDDKERLEAMSESQLVNALCVETDEKQAKEVLTANGFNFEDYEKYVVNKDGFKSYQEAEDKRIKEIKDSIIEANSDYTEELLNGKSETELLVINKMITGNKHAARAHEGKAPATHNSAQVDSYEM